MAPPSSLTACSRWDAALNPFLYLQGLEIVAALRLFSSRATGLVIRLVQPLQQLAEQLMPTQQLLSELQEQHCETAAAAASVDESQDKHAAAQVTS